MNLNNIIILLYCILIWNVQYHPHLVQNHYTVPTHMYALAPHLYRHTFINTQYVHVQFQSVYKVQNYHKLVLMILYHCCTCSINISHFLPESDTSVNVLDELGDKSCCFSKTNKNKTAYANAETTWLEVTHRKAVHP